MKDMVDIEVVLDEQYIDPKVMILTRETTTQVEKIIYAIENISRSDYPMIATDTDNIVDFISQRDIVRVFVNGRWVILETEDRQYTIKKPLVAVECDLNPDRFLRISQSEIINIYKVKCFDFTTAGTIGVEFECGIKTWAARSRVKQIKELFKRSRENS